MLKCILLFGRERTAWDVDHFFLGYRPMAILCSVIVCLTMGSENRLTMDWPVIELTGRNDRHKLIVKR